MALYLGLDSSTQSLTAVLIDSVPGSVRHSCTVRFGADLPQYDCPHGFLPHADPLVRHADPRLWAAALEHVLAKLRREGVDLSGIAGISGSGQQHGTVYVRRPFPGTLARGETLADLVGRSLTRPTSPIWMDSSTGAECREIDAALGGAAEVRRRSGSSAVARFAGPQIRRFAKTEPECYTRTELIHLVSSFMCSLLLGKSAPIDLGDGAGMNLLNLATAAWDPELLRATARGLSARLPATAPSSARCGNIAPYLVERYGFSPTAQVVAWSGDNPNSLIGVGGWRPGTAVISLGTSDTYFAAMSTPAVDGQGCGHVFGNPAGGFMCLICFKNGSLAREQVKEAHGLSWPQFDGASICRHPAGQRRQPDAALFRAGDYAGGAAPRRDPPGRAGVCAGPGCRGECSGHRRSAGLEYEAALGLDRRDSGGDPGHGWRQSLGWHLSGPGRCLQCHGGTAGSGQFGGTGCGHAGSPGARRAVLGRADLPLLPLRCHPHRHPQPAERRRVQGAASCLRCL